MAKITGKVREKSGNFVSPEKWEPWLSFYTILHKLFQLKKYDHCILHKNGVDLPFKGTC